MQRQKRFTLSLVVATIVILLAIFLHTTFAYFTSTGTKKGELQFAVLNVNILSSTDGNNFTSLDDSTFTTRYFKNVQPGSTINLNNLQVKNTSDISVYALVKLNIEVSATDLDTISYTEWYNLTGTRVETSNFSVNTTGATLLEKNGTSNFAIPFVLDGERFDNAYQNSTVKTTLSAYAVQSNLRDSDMYVDEAQYAAYFIIKDDVSYVSLPEDYTQVEYIQSTGTQYIDSGISADVGTIIETTIKMTSTTTSEQIQGNSWSGSTSPNCACAVGYAKNASTNFIAQAGRTIIKSTTPFDTEKHKLSLSITSGTSATFVVDDVDTTTSTISFEKNDTYSIYVLARKSAAGRDNYLYAKLYSFKIYSNDVLVRNMIPCYRNSDNKVGMYDMVNDVFYTNAGTGEFQYYEDITKIDIYGYPLMKTGSVVDSLTTNSEGKAVLTRNVGTYVFTGDETFTLSNGEYVFSKSSIDGINSSSTDLKCSHFDLTSSTGTMMTFRVDSSSIYFNFDNGLGGIDGFKEYLKDRYSKGDPVVIAYPLQTSTTSTISPTKNLYSGEQTLTFETGMETNNTDGTIYIEGDDVLNCAGKTLVVSYKLRRYEDDGWTDSTYPPFVGYAFYDSSNQIIQDSQKVIYLDNYTMTSNDGTWTYLWFTIDVSDTNVSKIAIQLAGGGTSTQYRHYDIKQIQVEVGTQPSL